MAARTELIYANPFAQDILRYTRAQIQQQHIKSQDRNAQTLASMARSPSVGRSQNDYIRVWNQIQDAHDRGQISDNHYTALQDIMLEQAQRVQGNPKNPVPEWYEHHLYQMFDRAVRASSPDERMEEQEAMRYLLLDAGSDPDVRPQAYNSLAKLYRRLNNNFITYNPYRKEELANWPRIRRSHPSAIIRTKSTPKGLVRLAIWGKGKARKVVPVSFLRKVRQNPSYQEWTAEHLDLTDVPASIWWQWTGDERLLAHAFGYTLLKPTKQEIRAQQEYEREQRERRKGRENPRRNPSIGYYKGHLDYLLTQRENAFQNQDAQATISLDEQIQQAMIDASGDPDIDEYDFIEQIVDIVPRDIWANDWPALELPISSNNPWIQGHQRVSSSISSPKRNPEIVYKRLIVPLLLLFGLGILNGRK